MSMGLCNKCLESNWSFARFENVVRATCNMCAHEIEFGSKQSPKKPEKTCKDCAKNLELKKARKHKSQGAHWFTHYWWCKLCNKHFLDESFKVFRRSPDTPKEEKSSDLFKVTQLPRGNKY